MENKKGLEEIITKDEFAKKLSNAICQNEELSMLLWSTFFEINLMDEEDVCDKIFQYGSKLQAKDNMGRMIFVRMMELFDQYRIVTCSKQGMNLGSSTETIISHIGNQDTVYEPLKPCLFSFYR